jgi:hypothetical protein
MVAASAQISAGGEGCASSLVFIKKTMDHLGPDIFRERKVNKRYIRGHRNGVVKRNL